MVCYIRLCADAIETGRNQSSGGWWDDFLCAEVKLPTKVGSFTASVADCYPGDGWCLEKPQRFNRW